MKCCQVRPWSPVFAAHLWLACCQGIPASAMIQSHMPPTHTAAEVNSILSDTMGILQQFLAASSAASAGRYAAGTSMLPSSASELQPSDPFR